MRLPFKVNWRSPKFWALFVLANLALSPTVWGLVLYAIAMPAKAGETTMITTTEKQTPIRCEREGDMMVCTTMKVTVVTTTMTAPAPKQKRVNPEKGA